MRSLRTLLVVTAAVALVVGLAGWVVVTPGGPAQAATCGGLLQPPCPTPTPTPTPTPAPTPPSNHTVGSCHQLTLEEYRAKSDPDPAVPCTRTHQSLTVKVLHLLAGTRRDDNASIVRQVGHGCIGAVVARAGGWKRYDLALYRPTIFLPTQAQWRRGARWVRCDLVLIGGGSRVLQPLPANSDVGVLSDERTDLCRQGRSTGYRAVACARRHQFRADTTVWMRSWRGTKTAASFARRACLKREFAASDLVYEYPVSRSEFRMGDHFAVCEPRDNATQ